MRALTVITSVLVNPYTIYALKSHITSKLVRIVPSIKEESEIKRSNTFRKSYLDQTDDPKRKNLLHNLIKNFSIDQPYQPVGFCRSFV